MTEEKKQDEGNVVEFPGKDAVAKENGLKGVFEKLAQEFAVPDYFSTAMEKLQETLNKIDGRLSRIEELPDTAAILAATKEIHEAHVQFENTTRSLQQRMIDAAEIKGSVEVIRNRCNNVMQIAPLIDNLMGLLRQMAAQCGGTIDYIEGVYLFKPNAVKKAAKKKAKSKR